MATTKLARLSALAFALTFLASLAFAEESVTAQRALWLRAAAISPDGRTVAFSYRGDLWTRAGDRRGRRRR